MSELHKLNAAVQVRNKRVAELREVRKRRWMKIIQILVAPDSQQWQGNLLGLGDDGKVYIAESKGWKEIQDDKVQGEPVPQF